MRIALFHNLPSGGAKRAVHEWTRRLTTRHEVDVFTLSSADHAFCDIRPFVSQHRVFDFSPRALWGSPLGRLNQWQRWRDLGDLVRTGQQIAQVIDAAGYDIIFANACRYTFIPPLLQFTQRPSLYYLHEPFGHQFTRQCQRPYFHHTPWRAWVDQYDPLIQLYQQGLEQVQRKSLFALDHLLANSRFTQAQMQKTFGVSSAICYLGVDPTSFYPLTGNRKKRTVLSVGELSPRKGFDFLVKSLAYIPQAERPTLTLACNTVVPQERAYVEALAVAHGVDLQILTNLNVEQLRHEYNRAQLCLYAPVAEPFGLVPLEAMACGTTVVGVCEGGVEESILQERTGLLVQREPVKFATAVQQLLTNPELAAEYGQNGRDYVLQHWTWERAVERLEQYLSLGKTTRGT